MDCTATCSFFVASSHSALAMILTEGQLLTRAQSSLFPEGGSKTFEHFVNISQFHHPVSVY